MHSLLERIRSRVLADFATADSAHDIGHLDRVAELAARIAEELRMDPLPAQVAAYVHDYHRIEEVRQGRRPISPEEAEAAVRAVLGACEVPEDWHPTVLRAVELTGKYAFAGEELDRECPTAAAVHDADNLEAIGAVGIGRAFAFGGMLGEPLWDPHTDLKDTYREGKTSSILGHLYEKLIRLEADMLTEPGRRMAVGRTQLLHAFAAEFRAEWDAHLGTGTNHAHPLVEWEPRTGFLRVVDAQHRTAEPVVRIGFRGRVGLTLDERDRLLAVDLYEVPDALACSIPRQDRPPHSNLCEHEGTSWRLDPETGRVRIRLSSGSGHRRPSGTGDVEVQLRGRRPAVLQLHLREDPQEAEEVVSSRAGR